MTSRAHTITDAFDQAMGQQASIAVIHSSLAGLRPPRDLSRWDFLRAVRALTDRGLTLAFPAFTFSFCGGAPFHASASRSETGILAEWVAELADSIRSPHPIYSFMLVGPQAQELAACANTSTFGDDSIFAAFERANARLIMAGCDWSYCTQFHRYEEVAAVPYRYFKNFEGTANFGAGDAPISARMFVRELKIDPENDFAPAIAALRGGGKIQSTSLWGGQLESVSCNDLADVCQSMLRQNPLAFVAAPSQVALALKNASLLRDARPFRLALLGSANISILAKDLLSDLESLIPDRAVDVLSPPFGQLVQFAEGLATDGGSGADFSIFVDRLEDLAGVYSLDGVDADVLDQAFERYVDVIRRYRSRISGAVVVLNFMQMLPSSRGQADAGERSVSAVVASYNKKLAAAVADLQDVYLFDLNLTAISRRSGDVADSRLWHIGRFPFSDAFSRELARAWAGMVLASIGKTARLIIVDLDNTLWGGVVGEDGIDGLMIGGDFPGNAFQSFQKTLLSLNSRGVLLAVCSKNNHEDAYAVLRDHPDMLLRPDHFAAMRINWDSKSSNIQAICDELDLDVSSTMFIDDNPIEREQVSRNLPSVRVLELSNDPTSYSEALLRSPFLATLKLTESDAKRPQQYAARRKVLESRTKFDNPTAFFESLALHARISGLDALNGARAVQLSTKTNQFNTTTRRYSRAELDKCNEGAGRVLVIGLEDRYSAFEHVGLLIVERSNDEALFVDDFLLSCRVLGRGIETGLLHWLFGVAKAAGFRRVSGEVVETPRNQPARNVFKDAGFVQCPADGRWTIEIDTQSPVCPKWLSVSFAGPLFDKTEAW